MMRLRGSQQSVVRSRYLAGAASSYLAAATEVVWMLKLLAGSGFRVAAAIGIGLLGAGATLLLAVVLTAPVLRAAVDPGADRWSAVTALPGRHARWQPLVWVAVAAALLLAHRDAGTGPRLLIVIATSLGAVTNACMSYLLAQRILRPLARAALSSGAAVLPSRHGVMVRLLAVWGLCTAVPLGAIIVLESGARHGWPLPGAPDLALPVLMLGGIGLVAGLRGTVLAARWVSEPLREVAVAMGRVGAGELDTRTPVYDIGEIGVLQTGFNAMAAGLAERERLRDLFGRYVGSDVARYALANAGRSAGEVLPAAVLFVDLAGSTAYAAENPPDRVAAMLNVFFGEVAAAVESHGGFINKFEGDAALAIFGAPAPLLDPAGAALAAGRALAQALAACSGMPGFGIGVCHGPVFAGNIGAENRYEYTVIGDPVNAAARLADLAKEQAGHLLSSDETLLAAAAPEEERWHRAHTVTLRGRPGPTLLAVPAQLTIRGQG